MTNLGDRAVKHTPRNPRGELRPVESQFPRLAPGWFVVPNCDPRSGRYVLRLNYMHHYTPRNRISKKPAKYNVYYPCAPTQKDPTYDAHKPKH